MKNSLYKTSSLRGATAKSDEAISYIPRHCEGGALPSEAISLTVMGIAHLHCTERSAVQVSSASAQLRFAKASSQ